MTADLRDIVDLMLATGCRIGEAAGFIYPEIDLSSDTPTLTVSGTIVTETGMGTFRQPWTKSEAGYRTLFLPPFAVDILMRRMIESPANKDGAVFTTRNGTWRQVSNWERLWNRVVDGTAYDWVTFHTFRKSVATLIDQTVDSKAAQAQLGHANEDHAGALHPQGQGRARPDQLPRTFPAAHQPEDLTRPTRGRPPAVPLAVITARGLCASAQPRARTKCPHKAPNFRPLIASGQKPERPSGQRFCWSEGLSS